MENNEYLSVDMMNHLELELGADLRDASLFWCGGRKRVFDSVPGVIYRRRGGYSYNIPLYTLADASRNLGYKVKTVPEAYDKLCEKYDALQNQKG